VQRRVSITGINLVVRQRVALARTHVGKRLDRLQPEHLEKLCAKMINEGSAAGTAHQAHQTEQRTMGARTGLRPSSERGPRLEVE
jgi:hypothetical protein